MSVEPFVFVAYQSRDRPRVQKLVDALRRRGISVWWDQDIQPSSVWREAVENRLASAACVVACWTRASTDSVEGMLVQSEASRALSRKVLTPVRLERCQLPVGLDQIQTLDLTRWRGGNRSLLLDDLEAVIKARLLGNAAPRPRALRRLAARVAGVLAAAPLLSGGTALVADISAVSEPFCAIPAARTSLCRMAGIGGVATAEEEASFDAARALGCEGLRVFAARGGENPRVEDARRLLDSLRVRNVVDWRPRDQRLQIHPLDEVKADSEAQARQIANESHMAAAETACRPYLDAPYYRLRGSAPELECRSYGQQWACASSGYAICHLEEAIVTRKEVCS